MTEDEFLIVMNPILEQLPDGEVPFGGEPGSKGYAVMSAYYGLLKDLPPGALGTAVARHLAEATDRWLPTVGRLRRLAAEAVHGQEPHWADAWERLLAAARVWSRFDEGLALQAHGMLTPELEEHLRNLGGFIALKESDQDQMSVLQSNFRNAWSERSQRDAQRRALPEPLRPAQRIASRISQAADRLALPPDISPPEDR